MKRSRIEFENSFSPYNSYFEEEDGEGEEDESRTGQGDSGSFGNEVLSSTLYLDSYNQYQHHNQSPAFSRRKDLSSPSSGEMNMDNCDRYFLDAKINAEDNQDLGWIETNFSARISDDTPPPLQQNTNVNMNYIWNRDTVVYIGNLDSSITEQLLFKIFSTIGPISSLDLMKKRKGNKNRGICFITYANAEEALQAVNKYDGIRILSKDIFVRLARPHISFVLKGTGRVIEQQGNKSFSDDEDHDESTYDDCSSDTKTKFKKMKSKLNDYPQNKKY